MYSIFLCHFFVVSCFFFVGPTATCHVLRSSRPSFDVAELTVELSGLLPISSLIRLVVARPPRLAMAVSAIVLRPALCFVRIGHATGETLPAEPFSLKTRGVSERSNHEHMLL